MERLETFLKDSHLREEVMDDLLELSSLVRDFVCEKQYKSLLRVVEYTIKESCFEAFAWTMGILQEELEKDTCELDSFECMLGGSIPHYDELIARMQVNLRVSENGFEKVYDEHGEVESFFNVMVYKTGYPNITLVSSENFDTKDNDYVQYKLVFQRG